jgi:hypothetical protein
MPTLFKREIPITSLRQTFAVCVLDGITTFPRAIRRGIFLQAILKNLKKSERFGYFFLNIKS